MDTKTKIQVDICDMDPSDEPQVMAIEKENFEFPWTEDDFKHYRKERDSRRCVAKFKEKVVGFVIFELYKTQVHVVNFAIAKNFQRMGVGTQLVKKLHEWLSPQRRTRIVLEVRERNLAAQLFFREMGFRAGLPLLKNYYDNCPEDAYRMQYRFRKNPTKTVNFSLIKKIISFASRIAT